MEHTLKIDNVIDYVDNISDGGFWFAVSDTSAVLVNMTPKLLNLLGYDSVEAINKAHLTLDEYCHLISPNNTKNFSFADFQNNFNEYEYIDLAIVDKSGNEYYFESVFTTSKITYNNLPVYKVEVRHTDTVDFIFKRAHEIFNSLEDGMCVIKTTGKNDFETVYINSFGARLLGFEGSDFKIYNPTFLDYIYDEDKPALTELLKKVVDDKISLSHTYRVVGEQGNFIWINAVHTAVVSGVSTYIYISFMDVSSMKESEESAKKKAETLDQFVNSTPAGLCVFNERDDNFSVIAINDVLIAYINKYCYIEEVHGSKYTRDDFVGSQYNDFTQFVNPIDRHNMRILIEDTKVNGRADTIIRLIQHEGDKVHWLHVAAKSHIDSHDRMQLIMMVEDVSQQMEYERRLEESHNALYQMSIHDAMTGVRNRHSYKVFLEEKKDSVFHNTGVAFIDINGLKAINDKQGHHQGDLTIINVINKVKEYFLEDEIFRISGDEFVVIHEDSIRDEFELNIKRLNEAVNSVQSTAIGSIWVKSTNTIAKTVERAEEVMRIAKQEYYGAHREVTSKHRPTLLNNLLNDIDEGRFVMYLQPKAKIEDTEVIGAEALVRRIDDKGNIIMPFKFIPQLEEQNLISNVDFFMLEEVCKLLAKWNEEHIKPIKVSVNMSRVTLAEPDYLSRVFDIIDKYDIDRSQLEFEVTESKQTIDGLKMPEILDELKKAGIGVSLDDMGTEYSSLQMLPMSGIDTVKLDRSFILQITNDQGNILLKHVIDMCHDLGRTCIAEGVEDHTTRRQLEEMGCDMYQGYLLAKPIPVQEFEKMI